MKAHDLSKYQRLIGVEGSRIHGTFKALGMAPDREVWITAVDVTIYVDEKHTWGRTLYSSDLTGSVKDGKPDLAKHMVNSKKLADVEDVWDEMLAALVAVAEEFWEGTRDA